MGNFHNPHAAAPARQAFTALHTHGAFGALQVGIVGWASVAAVGHDVKSRQQFRERADSR